jgi:hemerythrin-like metal-binding protein
MAGTSGEGAANADLLLAHLLRFLAAHFGDEERLMKAMEYPELAVHQQEHEKCSGKLAELVSAVTSGELGAADCAPFIRDWLHNHLLGSDQRYAAWLVVKPEAVSLWVRQMERQACHMHAV